MGRERQSGVKHVPSICFPTTFDTRLCQFISAEELLAETKIPKKVTCTTTFVERDNIIQPRQKDLQPILLRTEIPVGLPDVPFDNLHLQPHVALYRRRSRPSQFSVTGC